MYLDLNHWINLAKAATGHPDCLRHHFTLERSFREPGRRLLGPIATSRRLS